MNHAAIIRDAIERHGEGPGDVLLPLVYEDLRILAAAKMRKESGNQTLQPTALVHEAWLRVSANATMTWENRAHFFASAARAMRRILIEQSRKKSRLKRNPDNAAALLDQGADVAPGDHVLMIHEALRRLETEDPSAAEIVLLKFFGGMGPEDIALMTGKSLRSVERHWKLARVKLYQFIQEDGFTRNDPLT